MEPRLMAGLASFFLHPRTGEPPAVRGAMC